MIRRLALAAVLALGFIGASATTTSASELPAASMATAAPPLCLYLVPVDFGWCISNPVHDLPVRP